MSCRAATSLVAAGSSGAWAPGLGQPGRELGLKQPGRLLGWEGFFVMADSAEDTLNEEALRRFDSIFRYLHGKALAPFGHLGSKSFDILARIPYSSVLSALPV